jgi:hypothetical protein
MAFWVGGEREVSWEALVKFVRNKLGGGHSTPTIASGGSFSSMRWHGRPETGARHGWT